MLLKNSLAIRSQLAKVEQIDLRSISITIKAGSWITFFRGLVANLDPGSDSLIVQILVAIIVGALATFRLWKARLLSLFGVKQ